VVAKQTFNYVDNELYFALRSWIRRRHHNKSWHWRKSKYFRSNGSNNWIFFAKTNGNPKYLDLFKAAKVPIKRHIKIRSESNPFDPKFNKYFKLRYCKTKRSWREKKTIAVTK
jgi:RNA-directed DNA polymerase